jgi:hypothetical protein
MSMLYVSGIGHVTDDKISAEYKKQNWTYAGIKKLHRCLKDNSIIQSSIKDFGRLDPVSKMAVAATALALFDASFSGSNDKIGVIGTSDSGSLTANTEFFKDYIDSGRKMARGNLFVYTLPSAPLAAASIAFGFKGPLFFEMYYGHSFSQLMKGAERIMFDQNCKKMIAIQAVGHEVSAYLIEELNRKPAENGIMTINELFKSCMPEEEK